MEEFFSQVSMDKIKIDKINFLLITLFIIMKIKYNSKINYLKAFL